MDVTFMDKLSEKDYIQAFDVNPTQMSIVMGDCLAKYFMGLEMNNQANMNAYMVAVRDGIGRLEIAGLDDGMGAADSQYDFEVRLINTEDGTDMMDGNYIGKKKVGGSKNE